MVKPPDVMVLGDIILDKYYIGNVDRISPEAPIPIVNVHKVRNSLGGAANVCNNLSGLKTSSELIGITGIDDNYKIIETLLLQNAIKNSILISDKFQTITKIRIIGEHQQVVRVDFEKNPKINLPVEPTMFFDEVSKADKWLQSLDTEELMRAHKLRIA